MYTFPSTSLHNTEHVCLHKRENAASWHELLIVWEHMQNEMWGEGEKRNKEADLKTKQNTQFTGTIKSR